MPLRPSSAGDHPAVLALLADRDQEDFGEPEVSASLVKDQWRSRAFNPERDAIVVEDEGRVVGYAAVFGPGDLAFVHPEREGEGIGAELLRWTSARPRARATLRQRVAAGNSRGLALLESAGYLRARSVCCLAWDGQPPLPEHFLPEAIRLEPVESDRAARAIHELDVLAFSENPEYQAETFEAFVDEHLSNPDLHQPSSRMARRGDLPVGFVLCRRSGPLGYVDLLAVAPDARRRGVGRALLCHSLSTLAGDGARETRLDVASDNPRALRLYRSVGMVDRYEVVVLEKPAA